MSPAALPMAAALLLAPIAALAQSAAGAVGTGPVEIGGMSESRCAIVVGDMPATIAGNATALSLPVQIDCNTPFTLYGRSANGFFRRPLGDGPDAPAELIGYTVLWPERLVDGEGQPIAAGFSASGAIWRQGVIAASAATRQPQQAIVTIRLEPSAASARPIIPDTLFLQIEAN